MSATGRLPRGPCRFLSTGPRRAPLREWSAWLLSDAAPALVSGLAIISLGMHSQDIGVARRLAFVDRVEVAQPPASRHRPDEAATR